MSHTLITSLCRFNPRRFLDAASANARARVAVSACLTGARVRYDGADKLFAGTAPLDQALELVPVCPEVGAGLAVPRPPVQLVFADGGLHARGRDDTTLDVSTALRNYARAAAQDFREQATLCGYIWKSRSPSCGLGSTPVFDTAGQQIGFGNGIQADYFQRELPWLHCAEETDLNDAQTIAAFVLICRLVFDLLHAALRDLSAAHRHYDFLRRRMLPDSQEQLQKCCDRGEAFDYLTAFKTACGQMRQEELLELFRD